MKNELQSYMDRPKRYDNIDGTGEMFMGLMLLGFALLGYMQAILPKTSMWRNGLPSLLFMYLVLIPFLGLGHWLQKTIKKRFTWPRTGYVAYRFDKRAWGVMLVIGFLSAMVGLAVIFLLVYGMKANLLAERAWYTGAMTLGRCVYLGFWPLLYAAWIFRMGRGQAWKWMVLLFMTLGLIAMGFVIPGNFIEISRPVTLFVGLVWFISGGATLTLYLRHTRPPVEEAE